MAKRPEPKKRRPPGQPLSKEEEILRLLTDVYQLVADGKIDHVTVMASSASGPNFEGSVGNDKVTAEHVIGQLQVLATKLSYILINRRAKAARPPDDTPSA